MPRRDFILFYFILYLYFCYPRREAAFFSTDAEKRECVGVIQQNSNGDCSGSALLKPLKAVTPDTCNFFLKKPSAPGLQECYVSMYYKKALCKALYFRISAHRQRLACRSAGSIFFYSKKALCKALYFRISADRQRPLAHRRRKRRGGGGGAAAQASS